ncbi:hypothetical protein Taro_038643 [Colocasia esculenta]|uniref:Aminotransferase-like plant mobile domain-containing protein n=1 Tax=Colocasia esculenta TaxID=4460 RepID=A0A843W8N7_COLES|nr:hypothetical protein [Colocasia esculenta]
MLNDDVDSTGFYSANERDVRYESYDYTLPTDYNPWSIGYGVIVANQDIIEVHVQGYNPLITIRNSVPLMYLPLLEDLDRASRYSWGGATLGYLYRQLSIACKSDAKAICGSLTLLQMWHCRTNYIIPPDEESVGIGRVEYMA